MRRSLPAYLAIWRLIRIKFSSVLKSPRTNFRKLLSLNLLMRGLRMFEQRNPNSKPRVFDDLRNSLFHTRQSISFKVDRAVSDRLDEIIDELSDSLSDEMREEFTRAKLCELCFTVLIDDSKKISLNRFSSE